MRAAPLRIRAATPRRIYWYLPRGDLNLNLEQLAPLVRE
jgi:hypothetical protein